MSLYTDTISTPEYQKFIKDINGRDVSSPVQQKRGTIQIFSQEEGVWVFYANGTVRTNLGSDRLGKVSEPKNWPKNPTVQDMVGLLQSAYKRLGNRERSKASKYERINANKKHQVILLYLIFDPEKLQHYRSYMDEWKDLDHYNADSIRRMNFEDFVKEFGTANTVKNYRIRQ